MTEFLDQSRSFPHCPGCGHPHVLRALDQALQTLDYPKHRVCLVTDIGCVGLSDSYFPTMHTVHTLHGRSSAIASGIQMGARASDEIPLKVIVLVGDGGAGIGLLHLVHGAQLNVDVTVLIHNNLIYGMTGGQHSVLTPEGLKTTTTPGGSPVPPLDLGALLLGAGTGFFARTMAPGGDLPEVLRESISHPGFSAAEIFELCPTFATKKGGVTGKSLREIPKEIGRELGVLRRDDSRSPFPVMGSTPKTRTPFKEPGIAPNPKWGKLNGTFRVILGGRAGERVQSAAHMTAGAACAAGLYATVRSDNPVTQGSGFSLAELTISSWPIEYAGMEHPDAVLVTAQESLAQIRQRELFDRSKSGTSIKIDQTLTTETKTGEAVDFRKRFGPKNAALGALILEIHGRNLWDVAAWNASISSLPEKRRAEPKATLEKVFTSK